MLLTKEEWLQWEKNKPTIIDYQPVQIQNTDSCYGLDCGHRSPYCGYCLPVCFLPSMCCCGKQKINIIEEGDTLLKSMLSKESDKCPNDLRGVWWFGDNVSHERLVTLSDADWVTDRYAVKDMTQNWTNNWTSIGCFLTSCVGLLSLKMKIEISQDNEWIAIDYNLRRDWMKRVDKELLYPKDWFDMDNRGKVGVSKGDILRISYDNYLYPKTTTYQYVLKRVAYLDDRGNVVKTAQWNEYMKRVCANTSRYPYYLENRNQVV
jgi:hypothetical protein